MSFINTPVKIPDVKGKITLRQYNDRTYVRYEIGRTYNRDRKSTNPKRVNIGLQIRTAPTLMLPNENYEIYFCKDGVEKMTEKERTAAENYEMTCNDFWMLNCLFEQMYLEFQIQAHRNPHFVVNAFKIQRINKVLVPLKRMMEDKPYGAFLEIPEEPREVPEEEELITTGIDLARLGWTDGDGSVGPSVGGPSKTVPIDPRPVRVRKTKIIGLDYSDVALLMTQYKGAMTRFASDCL